MPFTCGRTRFRRSAVRCNVGLCSSVASGQEVCNPRALIRHAKHLSFVSTILQQTRVAKFEHRSLPQRLRSALTTCPERLAVRLDSRATMVRSLRRWPLRSLATARDRHSQARRCVAKKCWPTRRSAQDRPNRSAAAASGIFDLPEVARKCDVDSLVDDVLAGEKSG
jgi:hypothetical protein